LPNINSDLSQGDIIRDLPVWIAAPTLVFLDDKRTLSGGRTGWIESSESKPDDQGFSHLLVRARQFISVVLTHDCQLDKQKKRARVQLAATSDIESLSAGDRTIAMNQRSLSQLVLPDVPQLGTRCADMRIIFTVDKNLIAEPMRVASMTEDAKNRLQNQIIAYFADRQRPSTATNS
jgi:hypothetical protein